MIIVLYYSPQTIYPALLASLKHCGPALSPEQLCLRAAQWLHREYGPGKPSPFVAPLGKTSEKETVCLATAAVPPPLLGRTLNSLGALLESAPGAPLLLAAGPVPSLPAWRCRGKLSAGKNRTFWKELEVFVKQTRLQSELFRER